MKPGITHLVIIILALALAFSLGSQLTRAQVLGPTPAYQLSGENLPAATVMGDDVSIQGRLTDGGGRPLDGPYYISARIYNVSSGGTPLCSSSTLLPLSVENGLFSAIVSGCVPADFNGDQLWLGVAVGSDAEMTPRQRLNAVPYAWALRPGSIVKGADSYLFVPGSAAVMNSPEHANRIAVSGTHALISSGVGYEVAAWVTIPIPIPSVLYGVHTRITAVRVYYAWRDLALGYIGRTILQKEAYNADAVRLVDDYTHRQSIEPTYYVPVLDTTQSILAADESLGMQIELILPDSTSLFILYGVRLTLQHDY